MNAAVQAAMTGRDREDRAALAHFLLGWFLGGVSAEQVEDAVRTFDGGRAL